MKSEQIAGLSTLSPAWFASSISKGKWQYPKHLAFLDKILTNASFGKHNRIIINMPPRHGKSELISKYFPAWFLGMFPEKRIILTSYSASLAETFGSKVKAIISEYGKDYFGIQLSKSKYSAKHFEIDLFGGGLSCVGVSGAITGKGADLLIIDDPLKNDREANSSVIRNRVWDWFSSTAYTRLEPDGLCIIVMTRWHEDDLCGKLLKPKEDAFNCDKWKHICLPAIAESNDELNRRKGEPLWEERFSLIQLNRIRKAVGEFWFASLYQQKPNPSGGGIFRKKYFKYFRTDGDYYILGSGTQHKRVLKKECRYFQAVDLAATIKETSDYTVVLTAALTLSNDILIVDIFREKILGSEHLDLIKQQYFKWKPVIIGIENVQYQITLIQNAMKEGLPVKSVRADKDKLSRALPAAAKFEAGQIYLPETSHWLLEFEEELLLFPASKHDDQVDCLGYLSKILEPISDLLPTGLKKKSTINYTQFS